MNWRNRVNPQLILISPNKTWFYTYWIKDKFSFKKNNAIYEYPQVEGATIQPLKIGAISYPLNFFFAGENHDIFAQNFVNALREDGQWQIVHPVLGKIELYPASISVNVDPTGSGNITRFETEWIYAKAIEFYPKAPAIKKQFPLFVPNKASSELITTANQSNLQGISNNLNKLKDAPAGVAEKFAKKCKELSTTISSFIKKYNYLATINKNIASIQRSITSTVDSAVIDVTSVGGSFQNLIQLPSRIDTDVNQKMELYNNVLSNAFSIKPIEDLLNKGDKEHAKNYSGLKEFVCGATIVAMSDAIQFGKISSRAQAISLVNSFSDSFSEMTDNLDEMQNLFDAETIEKQYFSQTDTYDKMLQLVKSTNRELLESVLSLSIEKRFTLVKPRCPMEIVITEYGDLGLDDENIDNFIAANHLDGNDILVVPSGREVVVYV